MKLVITGGGTAGHANPAIAIAEILKKNCHSVSVDYVGTPQGIERRLSEEAGIPYHTIEVLGLSRSLSPKNLRAAYLAIRSPRKVKKLLLDLSPDLVVGTGGYVSWPVLSAATRLGIPTAIHESNAIPGLTVRRLATRVDCVLLNFAEAAAHLPKKAHTVHVGNPLRSGFCTLSRSEARRLLGIPEMAILTVSFGGSLGAQALNDAVLEVFSHYTLKNETAYHIHGCGKRYAAEFSAKLTDRFGRLPERIRVRE